VPVRAICRRTAGGDIVFIDDSQGFSELNDLPVEFTNWVLTLISPRLNFSMDMGRKIVE